MSNDSVLKDIIKAIGIILISYFLFSGSLVIAKVTTALFSKEVLIAFCVYVMFFIILNIIAD